MFLIGRAVLRFLITAVLLRVDAHRLPVSAVIPVPPDVPDSLTVIPGGDIVLRRAEHVGHAIIGQAEVFLHRPPQADIVKFIIAVAQDTPHVARFFVADDHHPRTVQLRRIDAARFAAQQRVIRIIAEVPRERPRRLVVKHNAHPGALVGDFRDAADLVHHSLNRRSRVGIHKKFGRVIVIDEACHVCHASRQDRQDQRAGQDRHPAQLCPAQPLAKTPDEVQRPQKDHQCGQPAPAGQQTGHIAPTQRRIRAPKTEDYLPEGDEGHRQRHQQHHPFAGIQRAPRNLAHDMPQPPARNQDQRHGQVGG